MVTLSLNAYVAEKVSQKRLLQSLRKLMFNPLNLRRETLIPARLACWNNTDNQKHTEL